MKRYKPVGEKTLVVGIMQAPGLNIDGSIALLGELQEYRSGIVVVPRSTVLNDAIRNTRMLVSAAEQPGLRALSKHWIEAIAYAEPTLIDALVEEVFATFSDLPDYTREELTRVIEAYFSTNGTVSEIAAVTYRHRNTIRNRLAQVEELTGLSLSKPHDAALLALAFPPWKRARDHSSLGKTPGS